MDIQLAFILAACAARLQQHHEYLGGIYNPHTPIVLLETKAGIAIITDPSKE